LMNKSDQKSHTLALSLDVLWDSHKEVLQVLQLNLEVVELSVRTEYVVTFVFSVLLLAHRQIIRRLSWHGDLLQSVLSSKVNDLDKGVLQVFEHREPSLCLLSVEPRIQDLLVELWLVAHICSFLCHWVTRSIDTVPGSPLKELAIAGKAIVVGLGTIDDLCKKLIHLLYI